MATDNNGFSINIDKSDIKHFFWLETLIEKELCEKLKQLWLAEHDIRVAAAWLSKSKYDSWYRPVRVLDDLITIFSPNKGSVSHHFNPINENSISVTFDRATKMFTIYFQQFPLIPITEKEFSLEKMDKNPYRSFEKASMQMSLSDILLLFK